MSSRQLVGTLINIGSGGPDALAAHRLATIIFRPGETEYSKCFIEKQRVNKESGLAIKAPSQTE